MKIEKRSGDLITFSEWIGGRTMTLTTRGGEAHAREYFDYMLKTGGIERSPPVSFEFGVEVKKPKPAVPREPCVVLRPPQWDVS